MHNSKNNVAMDNNGKAQFTGNAYLLQNSDQSSTCLRCHANSKGSSYKSLTYPTPVPVIPVNFSPGGDFVWLQSNETTGTVTAATRGARHGHNIIALDFGLASADPDLASAPGGTAFYPNGAMSCISCHDPHPSARIINAGGSIANRAVGSAVNPIVKSGSTWDNAAQLSGFDWATEAAGVYRILGGVGYRPDSLSGTVATFNNPPPGAVAPKTYNKEESTNEIRVAYGTGMSEWCANCHGNIHNAGLGSKLIHPASSTATLGGHDTITNYNAYVKSGDLTGSSATSYTSMVPFERGTRDLATLYALADNNSALGSAAASSAGPTSGSNVMCLSCHRAHASGFAYMSRWSNTTNMITAEGAWPGTDAPTAEGVNYATGKTQAQYKAAMYNRNATPSYAVAQRSLCNKCHAKD